MAHLLLLVLFLHLYTVEACADRAGLRLLTNTSCICPGQQIVYECVTVGPAIQFTVWRGSALECSNGISLRHGLFRDTGYANATCNNGAVMARIVSLENNCHTSQLIVNTSLNFDGKSVQCSSADGSTETPVGTRVISITTVPFPTPTDVRLVDVQPGQITFSWTSVDPLCQSATYNTVSSNCGQCPPATTDTTVTCVDVVLGHVCTFYIQAVVCGNHFGNLSCPVSVILKVPGVSIVKSTPYYDHERKGLLSVAVRFEALNSITISNGFENRVTSYNITYSDTITGNICGHISSIPTSLCHGGVCMHTFKVSSSFCHPSTNVTFSVRAITLLGAGPPSDPITIDSRNNFFDTEISFEGKTLTVVCTFLNVAAHFGERSFTILFGSLGQAKTCTNLSHSITTMQPSNQWNDTVYVLRISVDVSQLLMKTVNDNVMTCLVMTASEGNHTAKTEREILSINSGGCSPDQLSDGTTLTSNSECDFPLFTAGIKDGLVCYTGTSIGSIAIQFCFEKVMSTTTQTVRTCLPNGTWTGEMAQCDYRANMKTNQISAINYIAPLLGIGILIISIALIIVIVLLVMSRTKMRRALTNTKDNTQAIYEDIETSQFMKNPSYDVCRPQLNT